jgi:hypothetical protein
LTHYKHPFSLVVNFHHLLIQKEKEKEIKGYKLKKKAQSIWEWFTLLPCVWNERDKGKYDEFRHVSINDVNYAWAFTHHLLLQHWSQQGDFRNPAMGNIQSLVCAVPLWVERGNRPAYYYKYHAWFPIARGGTVHLWQVHQICCRNR